jgi:RNA polymerase sigma factor (TIGR02999 family)
MSFMSKVTRLLNAIGQGDSQATAELLPIVYQELRTLARVHMGRERAAHTLQATDLVHEAYLRLVDDANARWDGRGHFFAAAAEAMRRILIEHARRKQALKHGGGQHRVELMDELLPIMAPCDDMEQLLALDEALDELQRHDSQAAQLVKLRFFAGLSHQQAADALQISRRAADRLWLLAKAWLFRRISQD